MPSGFALIVAGHIESQRDSDLSPGVASHAATLSHHEPFVTTPVLWQGLEIFTAKRKSLHVKELRDNGFFRNRL